MKLEFVVDVTDGENDAIIQVNSCEADVTFNVLLQAGVCRAFVSAKNNQASNTSIELLMNVFAPAVTVLPFFHIQDITIQQLSATVVTDWDQEEVVVGQFVTVASGWPDCFTPVYETDFAIIEQVPLAETTILFAPVAGAIRYQKYILEGALLFIVDIWVIATPL